MKTISLLGRWPRWCAVMAAAVAVAMLGVSAPGLAAKGGIKGPPTGGETAGNNLSFPGLQTESANSVAANWATPAAPVLGVHYSYGCDIPEAVGQFSYPNTSCVDNPENPAVYFTAEACVAPGNPCAGLITADLSRIYWQKVDVNEWWADDEGILGQIPDSADVAYIDWGDALEVVSWNERSVLRVETQPYGSTIPGFDPEVHICTDPLLCKTGFQMWHVSGQGITEHWGVRATDASVSFNYSTPFQIINTTKARLNLTKLEAGAATCGQPGGNPGDLPPEIPAEAWTGSEWTGTCTLSDAPYTVETSVGGKYVYGYNWRMKNVELESICGPTWVKTGFWRLTFYVPDGADLNFVSADTPNVAPPAIPAAPRTLPLDPLELAAALPIMAVAAEEEEDPDADDRLYRPVIDTVNNLSYLDICIVPKSQGGGGGKGGGGSGGGTGGGGSGGGGGGGGPGKGGGGGKP